MLSSLCFRIQIPESVTSIAPLSPRPQTPIQGALRKHAQSHRINLRLITRISLWIMLQQLLCYQIKAALCLLVLLLVKKEVRIFHICLPIWCFSPLLNIWPQWHWYTSEGHTHLPGGCLVFQLLPVLIYLAPSLLKLHVLSGGIFCFLGPQDWLRPDITFMSIIPLSMKTITLHNHSKSSYHTPYSWQINACE